jgi:rhamnopyranosyl-N-acetylglucosaminyl-diphospho-decaprenol beta-1,3/1,4-galactofuranosyltransferase
VKDRVCAIVVTHNRKDLLSGCLQALLRQSRPLDEVVVVNNASTDGTKQILSRDFPQVRVLDLSENVGGAGGFHAGIKWAHDNGFDWIWVMDDDIEPFPGTLEVMLGYKGLSDFIHVRREGSVGAFIWEGTWDFSAIARRLYPDDLSFKNGREWISVNSGNFEGALIHRRVVDNVGLPDPRFFIGGDDSIYGYLASFHTNVIYVNYFGFRRKLPSSTTVDPKKLYFEFRNRFLLYEHLRAAGAPVSKISLWFHTLLFTASLLKEEKRARSLRNMGLLALGVRDGARGRYGRPGWL